MRIGWFAVAASCLWRMTWAWAPPPPFTARSSGFFRNPQAPAVPVRMATSGADAAVPSEARRVCLIRGIATAGLVFAPAAPVAPCFAIDEDEDDDDDEAPPTPTPRPKAKRMEKAAEDEEEAPKPEKKRRAKAPAIRTDTFELADINKDPPLGPDGVCLVCPASVSFALLRLCKLNASRRMHACILTEKAGAPNPKTSNPIRRKTTKQKKEELAGKRGLPSTEEQTEDKPQPRNVFSFLPGQVDIPIITK